MKTNKPKALWTTMRGGLKPRKISRTEFEELTRRLSTRIQRVSKARAAQLRVYAKKRKAFLNWKMCQCQGFKDPKTGKPICYRLPHLATDIHHSRGRIGKLLTDERFFIGVCREAHSWIGRNVESARKLGLICARGHWNKIVKP
jgi:hypothetical protein